MAIYEIQTIGWRQLGRKASDLFRFILLSGVVVLASPRADAQATGSITGTVINRGTQKSLERAVVSVEGTRFSTDSDNLGSFRIVGLSPGTYVVTASYADLDEAKQTVVVTAGQVAKVDFALSSAVYTLDVFTVSAEREGTAYAVQQERTAESFRNVVSADAFGVVSDANPGEFLKLIPGIDMDRQGVEPRGVRIRGMEPNLNLVMIDGNQAAAAASSSTGRNFEFDQTTIDNIETIEVYKAPLPSMPANSIGGIVNMVTRSAFLQKGRRITASLNTTFNSHAMTLGKTRGPFDQPSRKVNPGGAFMYSNSFLDNRLGVVFSISQVNLDGIGNNVSRGLAYTGAPATGPYPADIVTRTSSYGRNEHGNYTERTGASLNLDYKVNESTTLYLRTTFSDHFYYFANRTWNLGGFGTLAPGADASRVQILSGGTATQGVTTGDKVSQSLTFNPGVRHRFGDWTIDYDFSQSRATNRYDYLPDNDRVTGAPNFAAVNAVVSGLGFVVEFPDTRNSSVGVVTQTAGPNMYDLANYRITGTEVSTNNRRSVDLVSGAKGRIRKDFVARFPFYVEVGGRAQTQERTRQQPGRRWTYVGPDGIAGTADDTTAQNLLQFAEVGHVPDMGFGQPAPNAWISPFQMAKLYISTPQAFVLDQANAYETNFRNNQTITEEILAGYAMANVKFGKLSALVGVRVERTEIEAEGALQNNADVPAGVPVNSLAGMIAKYSRTTASTSHSPDPFKYVHLTYRHSDQLQARAAYTEAIGRPNFGSILPNTTVNEAAQTLTISNTELRPQRSSSYDFSLEWYPSGTSSFTASWFTKDIKDYISNSRTPITAPIPGLDVGPEYVGFELITSGNLGSATIEGYEIGGRFHVSGLKSAPNVLRGLELFANFTNLYKLQGTFDSASTTAVYNKLNGTAEYMWNYGFSYYSPNRKWFFNLRGNYVGDKPGNIQDRPNTFTIERLTYDAEIRYKFSHRYTLSLAGRNVTEQYEGTKTMGYETRTGDGGGIAWTLTMLARF